MRQRVFVAMPFGKKVVRAPSAADGNRPGQPEAQVDFDEVLERLIEPALRQANCEPFRADQEPAAGDIRTDMYYELVTADFVLADISILSANVFYELGIRHGVAPRGVLTLHGGWSQRPFDVAPDRNIAYEGALFDLDRPRDDAWNAAVDRSVQDLTRRLKRAIESDQRTIGSPVYKELQGLRPADASNLQVARAKYFGMELENWRGRIAVAAKKGYAGDILALARDAPNRVSERRIALDAARGLVSLQRYPPAKELLTQLLAEDPGNVSVLCELGQVEGRLGESAAAEERLKEAIRQLRTGAGRSFDPEAYGMLGRVRKDLWRLRWEDQPDLAQRQRAAGGNAELAEEAVTFYAAAFRNDLGSYWNGVNAYGLTRLLEHLRRPARRATLKVGGMPATELTSVVRVAARRAVERVEAAGATDPEADPAERVWALATLGELKLLEGRRADAVELYRRAASSDAITLFQVDSMQTQIRLYHGLGLQPDITGAVLEVLADGRRNLPAPGPTFDKVVVSSGHMVDAPGRPSPRFPPSAENTVRRRIAAALDIWQVGEGDLGICGGARGSDILFAESCLDRGATVRLYLPRPQGRFLHESVRLPGTDWEQRFGRLAATCEIYYQEERLGPPPAHLDVFTRNNLWMIDLARVQAARGKLHVLLVWDGKPGDGPGGASDFEVAARSLDAWLEVIDPLGGESP
jgi:tetratricopeptide (TPR) repeat protein